MGIASIIALFGNVAVQALGAYGVISPQTQTLITGLAGGVTQLIPALTSGQSKLQDALAVLAGIQSMLSVLMADPQLPADKLAELKLLSGDVEAGIQAYIVAGEKFDPALYAPVQPVA